MISARDDLNSTRSQKSLRLARLIGACALAATMAIAPQPASAGENTDFARNDNYADTPYDRDRGDWRGDRDRDGRGDRRRDRDDRRGDRDDRWGDRDQGRILPADRIKERLERHNYRNVHNVEYSSAQGHYHADARDLTGANVRLSVDPWSADVLRTEIIDYGAGGRRDYSDDFGRGRSRDYSDNRWDSRYWDTNNCRPPSTRGRHVGPVRYGDQYWF